MCSLLQKSCIKFCNFFLICVKSNSFTWCARKCYLHTESKGLYISKYKYNVFVTNVKLGFAKYFIKGTIRQFAKMAETDIWLYFLLCIVLIIAKNHVLNGKHWNFFLNIVFNLIFKAVLLHDVHSQCYLHTESKGLYISKYKLNVGALVACNLWV